MYRISSLAGECQYSYITKAYDGHLIVKAWKSKFGKVRVVPQNMDISHLYCRPPQIYRLFRIYPQVIDGLAKTLVYEKLCGNPFPLTNLISSNEKVPSRGGVTRVSEWIRMPPPPPPVMGLQSLPSPGIGLGFHSK